MNYQTEMPFGLDVGDYGQRRGWLGRPDLRTIRAPRFGRAWFLRRQLDWITETGRKLIDRSTALRKRIVALHLKFALDRRFRSLAKETPVTLRDAQDRQWVIEFHVTRAMLRKEKRRLRDLVRLMDNAG